MKIFSQAILVTAGIALLFCIPAMAGGKRGGGGGAKNNSANSANQYKQPYDVISAIDVQAQTITVDHVNSNEKGSSVYHVDHNTEVELNGEDGALADVKTGMQVKVSTGADENTAERLVLKDANADPSSTPSKKKGKH